METQNTNLDKENKFVCYQEQQLEDHTKNTSKKRSQSSIAKESLDFLRIKQAVEEADEIDNTEKIQMLKKLIEEGNYEVDLDELSEKITKHLL